MLKSARQTRIRQLVEANGHVSVNELNLLLEVSEATIRRDLDALAQSGWVRRTHGGAVRVTRAGKEPPILQRQVKYQTEKQLIGQRAASMVKEGQTIFLGSGTTVHEVARNIRDVPDLTIITNTLNVVNELVDCDNVELVVIGGMFRQSELSMVGHIAEQAIREFRADKVIMGMRGVDPEHGFTSDYLPEAITDRAILSIAPCNIDVLVTDKAAPPEIVSEMEELGLEVQLV
jgi:DeoR/GlpR family transcriptional regulator of sugar metabolism